MDTRCDKVLYGIWIFMLVMTVIATIPANFQQDATLAVIAIAYSGVTIQILGSRDRQRQHHETIRLLRRIAGIEDEEPTEREVQDGN